MVGKISIYGVEFCVKGGGVVLGGVELYLKRVEDTDRIFNPTLCWDFVLERNVYNVSV